VRVSAKLWGPIVLLIVATGIALFMFDFPRAPDDEMAPSIRKGDLLFACRVCGAPRRGDVVLFTPPDSPGRLCVRRVVGIPGDSVEVRRGEVQIDGAAPTREAVAQVKVEIAGADGRDQRTFQRATELSGGHRYDTLTDLGQSGQLRTSHGDEPKAKLTDAYFLEADLRTLSRDSRDYGPVGRAQIRSRVLRILNAADGDGARQRAVP
jgi:signal peptidase I